MSSVWDMPLEGVLCQSSPQWLRASRLAIAHASPETVIRKRERNGYVTLHVRQRHCSESGRTMHRPGNMQ